MTHSSSRPAARAAGLLLFTLAAAQARAQDDQLWLVEGRTAAGVPYRGALRLEPAGAGWRYLRTTRDARGRELEERGLAAWSARPGGEALLRTTPGAGAGLSARLTSSPASAAPPGGRYLVQDDTGLGVRAGFERLRRLRPGETLNDVRLLLDAEGFAAIRAELSRARRSIEIQTFHWQDDATGRAVAEILLERARAGVRVRCLVDALTRQNSKATGGVDFTRGLADELRAAGAEVIVAHPLRRTLLGTLLLRREGERRGVLNHDHRKLFIVDGRVGFTGGMNITADYEHVWHDAMVRVEGPAAQAMRELFADRWLAARGGPLEPTLGPSPEPLTGTPVQLLSSIPGVRQEIKPMYLAGIRGARRQVLVENPYVLDDDVVSALGDRARQGDGRVVLIVPSDAHQDVAFVTHAFGWIENELIRSGVELYRYRGRMVHAKVAVFDDMVTVGSANLDVQSLQRLCEANVVCRDGRLARTLEQRVFLPDMAGSDRAQPRALPWWQRITSGLFHLLRRLL